MEGFLSGVHSYVGFHVYFCEESFVADLTDVRFNPAVHGLEVFGKAESVDKAFPALLADMDPTIAVHAAMPFKTLGVCEALPAKFARERSPTCVEPNMAFQGSTAAEDTTALPALILQ